MARIEVHPDRVVVRLTASERALALRRRDVVISREAITSAVITDDPWVWLRGVRAFGAHVPRRLALGTWRSLGGRDFVVARSGRPAIVIDLDTPSGAETEPGWVAEYDDFARVILSTSHASELITALRLSDGGDVFTADTDD